MQAEMPPPVFDYVWTIDHNADQRARIPDEWKDAFVVEQGAEYFDFGLMAQRIYWNGQWRTLKEKL